MPTDDQARALVEYWVGEEDITPEAFGEKTRLWYFSKPETDEYIREHFGELLSAAERGELDHWADSATGMLALVILLDQFSRNLHRGSPDAFRNDGKAQSLLATFIESGQDESLTVPQKLLLYHPLHHAEDVSLQRLCVEKFRSLAADCDEGWKPVVSETVKFSEEHADIIEQFGRFPHRNVILGRQTTDAEAAFLEKDPRDYGQKKGQSQVQDKDQNQSG